MMTDEATEEYLTETEAAEYLTSKYKLLGFTITESAVYNKYRRHKLPSTKKNVGGKSFLYKKTELDQLKFTGVINWPELIHIQSSDDIKSLEETYGELVYIDEFIKRIYQYTESVYGEGKYYEKVAIKARAELRNLLVVAYTGTEDRKNLLYPVDQIPLLAWRPKKKQRKK